MKITKTKRIHSLIVGMGSKSTSTPCNKMDPWARNAPKSEPHVKGCLSVNLTACSVCLKLGVYQRLPIKAPQHEISSEGEDRATTPMMESGELTRWT